jgi:hypothetical protein
MAPAAAAGSAEHYRLQADNRESTLIMARPSAAAGIQDGLGRLLRDICFRVFGLESLPGIPQGFSPSSSSGLPHPREPSRFVTLRIVKWNGPVSRTRPQAQRGCAMLSILRAKVFESNPADRANAEKHGVSAISPAQLYTRKRRRIRLYRTPFPTCHLPRYTLGLGSGPRRGEGQARKSARATPPRCSSWGGRRTAGRQTRRPTPGMRLMQPRAEAKLS